MIRVAILVDVQNMFYSARNLYNAKIDYKMLMENLLKGRELSRALAFVVQRPDVEQTRFIDALTRMGYEVKIKEVKNKVIDGKSVPVKGTYELMLGLEAVQVAPKVDVVVLVTGEGAYVPLVRYLKTQGCKVEIASFDGSTSSSLIDEASEYVKIKPEWTFEEYDEDEEGKNESGTESQPIVAGQPPAVPVPVVAPTAAPSKKIELLAGTDAKK